METSREGTLKRLRGRDGRVLVVGHRGAMGHRPENTLASFEHAVALGADWIEFDVHLSRDDVPVVIHDETLERTTDGRGLVRAHTALELQSLDAGRRFGEPYAGARIPTLDEVLAWARGRGVWVDVEVKHGPVPYPGIEERVVAALERHGMIERAVVISFDHYVAKRVKALDARVTTGVLYAGRPIDEVSLARLAGADALLPHWGYVSREMVVAAHEAGLAVAPWVSSDPAVLRGLIALGVDAIATNHPDVLRALVDAGVDAGVAQHSG